MTTDCIDHFDFAASKVAKPTTSSRPRDLPAAIMTAVAVIMLLPAAEIVMGLIRG